MRQFWVFSILFFRELSQRMREMFSILSWMDRWMDEWWTVRHEMKQPILRFFFGRGRTPKFCLGSCLYSQPFPVTCAFKPGALVWVPEPQLGWLRCRGRRAQLRESKVAFLNLLFLFNQIAKMKFIKKGDLNVLKALIPLSVTQSFATPHESLLMWLPPSSQEYG